VFIKVKRDFVPVAKHASANVHAKSVCSFFMFSYA